MPDMNQFFRDAAMASPQAQQPIPGGAGAGLGGMLALQFINQNPQLKKLFEMQLQKMLVPQQAQTVQRPQVDQSVASLLSMSQGLPRSR